jgi:hypothetical protein
VGFFSVFGQVEKGRDVGTGKFVGDRRFTLAWDQGKRGQRFTLPFVCRCLCFLPWMPSLSEAYARMLLVMRRIRIAIFV